MASNRTFGAAEKLVGQTLENTYVVHTQLTLDHGHTGMSRSCCYLARGDDGATYFVKAMDFRHEERKGDIEQLVKAGEQYLSESRIHKFLTDEGISRVTRHVCSGTFNINDETVHYIVTEYLQDCLRNYQPAGPDSNTPLWRKLLMLRQVTSGLIQLHSKDVAHQDVKPSNIVVDPVIGPKLTDFGCSSSLRFNPPPSDSHQVPGDPLYAPFESLYNQRTGNWLRQRIAGDIFLLGGLCFHTLTKLQLPFLVCHIMPERLQPANNVQPYEYLIPYLGDAYSNCINDMLAGCENIPDEIRQKLVTAILELCHPDPAKRGHPLNHAARNPYGLQRYESLFDLLSTQARVARARFV